MRHVSIRPTVQPIGRLVVTDEAIHAAHPPAPDLKKVSEMVAFADLKVAGGDLLEGAGPGGVLGVLHGDLPLL